MTAEGGSTAAIEVILADASALRRRRLRVALDATRRVHVSAEARTGQDAIALVRALPPAVLILSLPLPGGLEVIESLMARAPVPIVVLAAADSLAQAALAAGALEAVVLDGADPGAQAAILAAQAVIASRVRPISHPRGRLRRSEPPTPAAGSPGADKSVEVVAIGASTGGPPALAQVLGALPADFQPAVLVVQHMAEGFLDGMADWLRSFCPLPVAVGATGQRLQPGVVTLAPSGLNLRVGSGLRLACTAPEAPQFHVPSIDLALASLAAAAGPSALGVLLTGMGRDGARGLRALRERGALTIAQDEATCAVYGMPRAAMALDAAERQLPLGDIGPALVRAVRERSITVVTR